MKLLERLACWLVPLLPKQRHMCIRCDEVKDDVPYANSRCGPCRAIVAEIALTQPDAYLHYLELVRKYKRNN